MGTALATDDSAFAPITTQRDVCALFLEAPAARRRYEQWMQDPRRERVRSLVLGHETRVLYRLSFRDVYATCKHTAHALGEINKDDVRHVDKARDWNPSFAFTHLLHYQLEQMGRIPTWEDFWHFLRETSDGQEKLGDEASALEEALKRRGVSQEIAQQAVQWRVGNAYYGILRDIFAVSYLREEGVDVRAHPLADALFRADGWVGRTVISLCIGNEEYRKNNEGRKAKVEDIVAGATRPFQVKAIELPIPHKYGVLKLPSRADLDQVIREARDGQEFAQ